MTREKDKLYRDAYLRSFLAKVNFKSKTMIIFSDKVKQLNSNINRINRERFKEI